MTAPQIRFDDGAAYEQYMGIWSKTAGAIFLDWLAPKPGLGWADIGCGNGAFTNLILDRCAPAKVQGVDPSEGQIAYARTHVAQAEFQIGDAMALPFTDRSVDAAVMALVIFFVPDPAKGVAEMVRITKPGGLVAAYAWDMKIGFPWRIIGAPLRDMGVVTPSPPSADASAPENMHALWSDAGLTDIELRTIEVRRTFESFDTFWRIAESGPSMGTILRQLSDKDRGTLQERVRGDLADEGSGRVGHRALANAVKGRVPRA